MGKSLAVSHYHDSICILQLHLPIPHLSIDCLADYRLCYSLLSCYNFSHS